jgi:tripeptidyl-peptidase-1
MLEMEFSRYHARNSTHEVLRTIKYSVPGELRKHINFIQPTTRFGGLKLLSSAAPVIDSGAKSDEKSK